MVVELYFNHFHNMSRIVRKRDYCLCDNKGADQLRSNCEADQRLCFRYSDSTFPLLLISEISSFWPASETVQAGLCRTWSETPKTGFLASRYNYAVSFSSQDHQEYVPTVSLPSILSRRDSVEI